MMLMAKKRRDDQRDWRARPDWERHRFMAVQEAHRPASQDGDTAPTIGRHIIEGAVRDPTLEGVYKRRIRLKVNADILDRELAADRITEGQYAAGRTYQRLVEISIGGASLDGVGTRDKASIRDDNIVRLMERAERTDAELTVVMNLIKLPAAMLLRQLLNERNLNTGKAWTIEDLARSLYGAASLDVVAEMRIEFYDALNKLAKNWGLVETY